MKPALVSSLLVCALCISALPAAEPAHDHSPTGKSAGLYMPADLQFLTHMIVHHQQALELCALVPTRSTREEFRRYARYLNDAQQAEIDQMLGLLHQAATRGAPIPEDHLHGDPPMTGMLSKAQIAAIAAARGTAFEQLWLKGMIYHHQGAVDMGLAQQEAQFKSGHQPWGVDVLVDDMLAVQRGEIGKMNAWLVEWR